MEDLTVEELALKIKGMLKEANDGCDFVKGMTNQSLETKLYNENKHMQFFMDDMEKLCDDIVNGMKIERNPDYMRLSTEKMKRYANAINDELEIYAEPDFTDFYKTRDFIKKYSDRFKNHQRINSCFGCYGGKDDDPDELYDDYPDGIDPYY